MGPEPIRYRGIVNDSGTRLPDHRQHPRFGIVVSVSTSPQVHFLRKGVGLVCGGELEDAVRRREGDLFPRFWMHALRCRLDAIEREMDTHRQTSL